MKLFDAHTHIQDPRLAMNLEAILQRAQHAGVCRVAVKGCHEGDWGVVSRLGDAHAWVSPSFGVHPWYVEGASSGYLQQLAQLLTSYPQAGVGEIGIDHAVESRNDNLQERVFLEQLDLARQLERPVSIHCRRAWGRLIKLLDHFGRLPRGMLIHCFGGSVEVAQELVKRGAWISFSGSITRPNNRKAGPAICAVPNDRLLIETDAPDILPSTMCDQAELNEPSFLIHILEKAAKFRGISKEQLAELTYRNTMTFFGLEDAADD